MVNPDYFSAGWAFAMSYLSDIQEQPEVVRSLVHTYKEQQVWSSLTQAQTQAGWHQILLTGMGGSYNALVPAWLWLCQQGVNALLIEASELMYYAQGLLTPGTVLVVMSQSGESIEIRRLIEIVDQRLPIISITNTSDNTLARASQYPLCTAAGPEVGVATKTYTSSLALSHLLCRCLAGKLQAQDYLDLLTVSDRMTALLSQTNWIQPAWERLQSVSHITFIGRGPALASALNGALILKEAARLPAMGLTGGQFRHGPMEAVSEEAGIILFANQGPTWELTQRLAVTIAERQGQVVLVAPAATLPGVTHLALPEVDEFLSPLLEVLMPQLLAAEFAATRNITPGQFRWSGKVIQEE